MNLYGRVSMDATILLIPILACVVINQLKNAQLCNVLSLTSLFCLEEVQGLGLSSNPPFAQSLHQASLVSLPPPLPDRSGKGSRTQILGWLAVTVSIETGSGWLRNKMWFYQEVETCNLSSKVE